MRSLLLSLTLVAATASWGQWPDVRLVGQGGEPKLVSDDAGVVYLTCHQPAKLYTTLDWGTNWISRKTFTEASSDMDVVCQPGGKTVVTFQGNSGNGIGVYWSGDFGNTMNLGVGPSGPLDRQWATWGNDASQLHLIYSHGFIGGPPSTGVFCARSLDQGQSFVQMSRVDNDVPPVLPVDPYIASGTSGRLYAMWSTTTDNNTIDAFRFAYSTDSGQSYQGHKTLTMVNKGLGDTQERWIMGSLVAVGPQRVFAFFANYRVVVVDGTSHQPLLVHYSMSLDGGQTFSPPAPVSSPAEIEAAIRNYETNKQANVNYPYYIQTQPWACADPWGRIHVVWQDNRSGQALIQGVPHNQWHVREASAWYTFGTSTRVSSNVTSRRPPLDFVSVAADRKNVYAAWVETPNSTEEWNFTGNLFVARRPNPLFVPSVGVAN